MSKRKRVLTACLLIILVFCLVGFELQLATLLRHDCAENHCHICIFIANIEQLLRTIAVCGACLLFLLGFKEVCRAVRKDTLRGEALHTPITEKVKITC